MMRTRSRLVIQILCVLTGSLVDSSSLPSSSLTVTSSVGGRAVLPCSWKSRLGGVDTPACHVQWVSLVDTVFEQNGEDRFEAAEFRGRLEVPKEKLGSGDCSLIISDVQIGDTGKYESFMVVDMARSKRTRVFIQSVKLSVLDHKSLQSVHPGDDLVLDLHTGHSVRVVFLGRNSSEWSDLWMRGDGNTQRLEKHPLLEQLTIKNLRSSDEGLYKVLDAYGLAVSTVQVSVEEKSSVLSFHQMQKNAPTGLSSTIGGSALLVLSALVWSFRIPRLL